MEKREILIVANETAGGEHLHAAVLETAAQAPCRFSLLVPATPPRGTLTWTEHDALALAQQRLDAALANLPRHRRRDPGMGR